MTAGTNGPPVLNGPAYAYPSQTLGSLRDDLLCMLGFPDPLTNQDSETKTLAQLRTLVINQCGLADPLTSPDSETRTLVQLRETVIRRTGHYYNAGGNAPGVDALTNSFINEAHQTVFRLAELDKGGTAFPAQMVNDNDATEIDYVPVLALAIGLSKAHNGQDDSKAYFDSVQKYLADRAKIRPPGIEKDIDTFISEAQQAIFRMVELDKSGVAFPADMVNDGDSTAIDYVPVLAFATGSTKAMLEHKDAKLYFDQVEKYMRDRALRRPPKIVDMATKWLTLAQKKLYRRYRILQSNLWWTISITAGEHFYDVPYDADSELDFRSVTEAWLVDGSTWLPLTAGINPHHFTVNTPSVPVHYELREYFELWPIPEKNYTAKIKGYRGLLAFAADNDVTTLDPEVILLQALVWGKRHFKDRPAAKDFEAELDAWIGALNGGRFAGRRFVPCGTQVQPDPLPYPQVTFPRT